MTERERNMEGIAVFFLKRKNLMEEREVKRTFIAR